MKKMIRLMTLTLVVVTMMVTRVQADTIQAEPSMTYGQQLETIMATIMEKYLNRDDVTAQSLYEAAMAGMFGSLDPYSSYIPADNSQNYTNSLNNTYVGIGVQLVQEGEYVVVTRVFLDGPAEDGGLKVHDKIVGVEGVSIVGFTPQEAANLILGDADTEVTITIDRNGYIFDVTLVRGTVVINAVDQLSILEAAPEMNTEVASKIGYLKIESFTNEVDEELAPILAKYKEDGKTHLLLDLRDNGGGYVDAAVAVLDMLVPEGPVLRFINNEGREIVYRSNNKSPDFEIVVLINENSASATEFVAAAIRESKTGVLIGETTFGKGVAQYLYNLEDGAIVKLTQEAFFTGDKVAIHDIGVVPDIEVEVPDYMTKQVKYHLGDSYPEVSEMEKILGILGYEVSVPDELYDALSVKAVKSFQRDQGLFDYGVCDFTTQEKLNRALIESMSVKDIQLIQGIETIVDMVESK